MAKKKRRQAAAETSAAVSATDRLASYLNPQKSKSDGVDTAKFAASIAEEAFALADQVSSDLDVPRPVSEEATAGGQPLAELSASAPPAPVVVREQPSVRFAKAQRASAMIDLKETAMTPQADDAAPGLRADLDKAPVDVAAMFDRVAARYDLVNDVLALGQTRIWRNMVVRAINPQPGDRILDLAAGTGTSSAPFAARGADVVPCDFSLGMLEVGKRRQPSLPFVAGDALNLPFRDDAFDAVTISFGLRNVQNTERALQEMLRVTKPGGKLVVCEFSTPVFEPFRTVYMEYLMKALPAIARGASSNPAAYVYLAESIREWPNQSELATQLQHAGWERVQFRNATGGVVAIHRGFKPAN